MYALASEESLYIQPQPHLIYIGLTYMQIHTRVSMCAHARVGVRVSVSMCSGADMCIIGEFVCVCVCMRVCMCVCACACLCLRERERERERERGEGKRE